MTNGLGYDSELLIREHELSKEFVIAERTVIRSAVKAQEHCESIGADFLFVLMPFGTELGTGQASSETFFVRFDQELRSNGVRCISSFAPMGQVINERNVSQYSWWKHDGHYKNTGYMLLA